MVDTQHVAVTPPRRGIETRRAIERAAIALFAELGYHATSMQKISTATGVQAAAIYHWFPNKEAILIHLQNDFMERLESSVNQATVHFDRPAEKLAAAVRAHVVFHGLHRKEAFVTDSEIRALSPEPRAALIAWRDMYEDLFDGLIRGGIDDGTFHTASSRVATYAILLQCTGVSMWFDPRGPLSLDDVADIHLELALGGLGASRDLVESAVRAVRKVSQ